MNVHFIVIESEVYDSDLKLYTIISYKVRDKVLQKDLSNSKLFFF